ncbi:MAG: chorismate synthase [Armatimonadetes bacterium]|nr:chorismate synthase [Armatimonadota bacterium]MCX7966967.1 chorismate synthase [Armatimonadota bacterium]MDW8142123.1 chorismate synthase [Armatimonadota bacterium]
MKLLTAGESHGPALVAVLEGIPAGLFLTPEDINRDLRRRQKGYGRGLRSRKIESDSVRLLSGVRHGFTVGSPITMLIENRDFENWRLAMSPEPLDDFVANENLRSFFVPRPGHADLSGAVKYLTKDLRPVLERASARETAARVAAGAVAKKLLAELGVHIASHVVAIGEVSANSDASKLSLTEIQERTDASELRCLDQEAERAMKQLIDKAAREGETLGGIFEILVEGVPIGLGSHVHWDRKLDGRLAQAIMSIPAIKGVEIGKAFELARKFGSQVHDPFLPPNPNASDWRFFPRASNNAGGLEGGITNGERIVVRGAMKPISTLRNPLPSVDLRNLQPARAHIERSDVCAVPAAAVVAEAMVALVIADAVLEKFGGDSMAELKTNINRFRELIRKWMVGQGDEDFETKK